MNSRQFLNSIVSSFFEKVPVVRRGLFIFPQFLFPEFLKKVELKGVENPFLLGIYIYISVFSLVFIVQALLAYTNGVLFVPVSGNDIECSGAECLQYFMGDYANLLNYTIFVEAYCISGVFFVIYCARIDGMLSKKSLSVGMNFVHENSPKNQVFSVFFVCFLSLIVGVGYAIETTTYPAHWYMNKSVDKDLYPNYQFAQYYYLYINYLLLQFCVFVGVCHFSLFKTLSTVSRHLRDILKANDVEEIENWIDENKVKEFLSPLATQVLISKVFVLSVILNMVSWKIGEPEPGKMHDIAVLAMVVIGMWIVTMPRYYIQYQIFKIRLSRDVLEYKDIRMPWIIGASATVDVLLVLVAGKILLNFESLKTIFGPAANP